MQLSGGIRENVTQTQNLSVSRVDKGGEIVANLSFNLFIATAINKKDEYFFVTAWACSSQYNFIGELFSELDV